MTVSQREATRAIMIRRGNINPGGLMWLEKTRVIEAIRVLVQEYPCFSRDWVKKFAHLGDMLIISIPRTAFSIASPNADIARKASTASRPSSSRLRRRQIIVSRAFKNFC